MKIPKELIDILNDNLSGSEELRTKLITFLLEEIRSGKNIREYFPTLSEHFKEFASISNFLSRLEITDKTQIRNFLNNELSVSENVFHSLYKNLETILFNEAKILTISNSKTLIKVFEIAFPKFSGIKFFVSESRPMNEGVIMAERLSQIGFDVTLITEAMIPVFVEKCDFAICGADKILQDGSIINKIGTKIIAITCKYYGKPFYALSTKTKFTENIDIQFSKHPETEIYSGKMKNFTIAENVYFEILERNLITDIITEISANKN